MSSDSDNESSECIQISDSDSDSSECIFISDSDSENTDRDNNQAVNNQVSNYFFFSLFLSF